MSTMELVVSNELAFTTEATTEIYAPILRHATGYVGEFKILAVAETWFNEETGALTNTIKSSIVFPAGTEDDSELDQRVMLVNLFDNLLHATI
jgi:hypothetical protein